MFRARGLALVPLTGCLLLMGACGDDGDDAAEPTTSLEIVGDEYFFEPADVAVPAGEEVTIDFANEGSLEHEWAVLSEEIESEDEFDEGLVVYEVEAIEGGTSTTETFTIEEPGTYQVICAIPGHFDQGMEGSLTVEEGSAAE